MTLTDGSRDPIRARFAVGGYRALTTVLRPFLRRHLQKRLARGKEDPQRWREKLGEASVMRPHGRLIWLHAVGLGETLALRGVIAALRARLPDAHFLVTSGTRASAEVFAANMPEGTIHQFLPFDSPRYVHVFLEHWRPDLSIWTEQEIWPLFVIATAGRGVPLALINARLDGQGAARRAVARDLYGVALRRFAMIYAQDAQTATYLTDLGAGRVAVAPLLKADSPPLACDPAEVSGVQDVLAGRLVWVAASTHPEDEAITIAAQVNLLRQDPRALLVIVPRDPARAGDVVAMAQAAGLRVSDTCGSDSQIWVIDRFGKLGLWYRFASAAFIGGTNSVVEGHNPWEAAVLGCPVLHGPRHRNFHADFAALQVAGGSLLVRDAQMLAQALQNHRDLAAMGQAAQRRAAQAGRDLAPMYDALAGLVT